MAKDKVCLIINPASGTDSKKNISEDVASAIDQKKQDLIIRVTGYPEHATEIARQAAKKNTNMLLLPVEMVQLTRLPENWSIPTQYWVYYP